MKRCSTGDSRVAHPRNGFAAGLVRGNVRRTSFALGAVLALVAALAAPAQGANKGDSLDELRASDQEIMKAIDQLNAQVAAQQAEVAAAQQAYDAAQQAVLQLENSMKAANERLDTLRAVVRTRAIEEYMTPRDDSVTQMLGADGFAEASRRNELLRQISNDDGNAIDEMKALKHDIDAQRGAAEDAQKLAERRRADAQKKLDELNAALADKKKAEGVLKDRMDAASAEDAGSGWNGGTDDGKVSNSGVRWPIHGNHPVTSGFGARWGRLHAGIDIGVPIGTPVFAAKGGKVTFSGTASGYGNYICIQSDGGLMTCYGHLSKFETSVGASVSQDTEIARSGNTGTSTGAHLHFETCISGGKPACFYDKNYKNPINYLP
jgi:murein DD-endopeptidase MepM/ murein hydrolase activator NlpD